MSGRITSLTFLHPACQERAEHLDRRLEREGIPLRTYETARSPWRQAELFARGRVPGSGTAKVTKAKAWQSNHQFGMALDKVFFVNGLWTWSEPEKGMWDRYHELAKESDLLPLSFEKPHVELAWNLSALRKGHLPDGWRDSPFGGLFLDWCEKWGSYDRVASGQTHPGAPPLPDLGDRPELTG